MIGSWVAKQEKWLLICVLIGLLLYLFGFYANVTSKQNTLFYLLVVLPWFCLLPTRFKSLVPKNELSLWVFLFVLYMAITTLWSGLPVQDGLTSIRYLLNIFILFSSVYFLRGIIGEHLAFLPWLLIFFGLWAAVVSVGHHILHFGDEWLVQIENVRFSIFTLWGAGPGNPINAGVVYGLSLLAVLWELQTVKSIGRIAFLCVSGLLFMWLMVASGSRGPILAELAVILLLIVMSHKRKRFLMAFCLIALVIYLSGFIDTLLVRFSEDNHRLDIWVNSIKSLDSVQLAVGSGLGVESAIPFKDGQFFVTHSHAFLIDILRLGGGVAVLIVSALLIRSFFQGLSSKRDGVIFCVAWLVYGCGCLMSNGQLLLGRPSISWFAFWIPLFLIISFHERDQCDS